MKAFNKRRKPRHDISTPYKNTIIIDEPKFKLEYPMTRIRNSKKHSLIISETRVVRINRYKNFGSIEKL